MRTSTLTTALWHLGVFVSVAHTSTIGHSERSTGTEVTYNGLTLYTAGAKSQTAVLLLTGVQGLNLTEHKTLADNFGRAGYFTAVPDLFDGHPWNDSLLNATYDFRNFTAAHPPSVTDPIIDKAVKYLKDVQGAKKIAVAGYSFGGRYAIRFAASGRGTDAVFAAHPLETTDDEILGVGVPTSVALAESDFFLPPSARLRFEELLQNSTQPYTAALYGRTQFGFAVSANTSIPSQKFAQDEAFNQATRWFGAWAG